MPQYGANAGADARGYQRSAAESAVRRKEETVRGAVDGAATGVKLNWRQAFASCGRRCAPPVL